MIQLDLITLAITLALVSAASVLVLFIFWRINKNLPGVMHWTLGGFFIAAAFLSIFMATALNAPGNLGPLLSNSMSLPAVLFTIEGSLRFRGYHSRQRWRFMLMVMPALVVMAWLNKDYPQARYLFHDAFTAIGMFLVGIIMCWRTADRYELQANSLAACSAMLIGVSFFMRWQYALLAPEIDPLPLNMPANQGLFLALILFTVGWTYGLGVACYFRSNRQVMQMAREDALTGLPNRRSIDENLGQALTESRRSRAPFAVMLIDVNGFKLVNDRFGHSAGDELLAGIARRLVNATRESDFAGRLGGDEFVVIARSLDADARLDEFVQRMRQMLNGPIRVRKCEVDVVVSIGVALWPVDGDSSDELLGRADALMYGDKARTSGQQCIAENVTQVPI
jgi:diguanylate cyclase (GGDEF)-like protein